MSVTISNIIKNIDLWEDYYTKIEALLYLLLSVRRGPSGDESFNRILYHCPTGGMITSMSYLSDKWGWSRKKVVNFIDILKSMGIVTITPRGAKAIILEVTGDVKIDNVKYILADYQQNIEQTLIPIKDQEDSQKEISFKQVPEQETVPEVKEKSTEEVAEEIPVEIPEKVLGIPLEKYIRTIVIYLNRITGKHFQFSTEKTVFVLGKWQDAGKTIEDCKERIDEYAEKYAKGDLTVREMSPYSIFKLMPVAPDGDSKKSEEIKKRRAQAEKEEKEYIRSAVEIFNDVMGNGDGRGPTADNMDARELFPILKKKGKTLDEIKYVCEVKKEEWKDNESMCHFLRISTLFNIKKFERYLGQRKNGTGKMIPKYKKAAKENVYGIGDKNGSV